MKKTSLLLIATSSLLSAGCMWLPMQNDTGNDIRNAVKNGSSGIESAIGDINKYDRKMFILKLVEMNASANEEMKLKLLEVSMCLNKDERAIIFGAELDSLMVKRAKLHVRGPNG